MNCKLVWNKYKQGFYISQTAIVQIQWTKIFSFSPSKITYASYSKYEKPQNGTTVSTGTAVLKLFWVIINSLNYKGLNYTHFQFLWYISPACNIGAIAPPSQCPNLPQWRPLIISYTNCFYPTNFMEVASEEYAFSILPYVSR